MEATGEGLVPLPIGMCQIMVGMAQWIVKSGRCLTYAHGIRGAVCFHTLQDMFVLHPRREELSSVWWDGIRIIRWVKDGTRAKQDPSWGTTDVFNLSICSVLAYWMRGAEWLPGAVMTHDNDFVREMANGIADVCGKCLASRKSMVTLFVDVVFCFSMWPFPSATGNPGNHRKTRSVLCLKCLRQYRILHQFAGLGNTWYVWNKLSDVWCRVVG